MTPDLSPITRKLLALTLLVVAILLAVNLIVVPLADAVGAAVSELRDARFRTERLAALAARPPPAPGDVVRSDCCLAGPSVAAARAELRGVIAAAAADVHVTLDRQSDGPADPAHPGAVTLDITASGDEASVVSFIATLEHGAPIVRLMQWRLTAMQSPASATSSKPGVSASSADDSNLPSAIVLHLEAHAAAVMRDGR